jgi:hypothetical protein
MLLRKIIIAAGAVLILIQFFRPEKNISTEPSQHAIGQKFPIPQEVNVLLQKSCYDCHSNNTEYPWYSNIQPVAWWLSNHVKDGKRHLNFDEFTTYPDARQRKKLGEIVETIEKGEMPMRSYTLIHGDARLSKEQQQQITRWANELKGRFPDSLAVRNP